MMSIGTPHPSVLHLLTLFRQITAGEIRIPAFQREFVWKEKQMIELLESVSEGFPIGSILLWGVDSKMLKLAPGDASSFPVLEEKFPTSYVLDGMQRLSTLYGVFHFVEGAHKNIFKVSYDLRQKRFVHASDEEEGQAQTLIPMSALFAPRLLLDHQAKLSVLDDADVLMDQLLSLQAAFQDYMVPVVTIRSNDVHRIVGIFEKINSTGTRLDPVDFMRAITWAEDFDLNHYLEEAIGELEGIGFTLSAETIIKCVGLALRIPPTTDGLLLLRNQSPSDLRGAFTSALDGLRRVAEFLRERFQITTSDLVPYEGQLLLLFQAIGIDRAEGADRDSIARWYWATGFNESLRGKPDHYVARAVDNWKSLIKGGVRGLEPRLKLTPIDLYERRLVTGGALTSTFATMHAVNGARDLSSGEVIQPSGYMNGGDMAWFEPIFRKQEILLDGREALSAKMFSNVVLVDRTIHRPSSLDLGEQITRLASEGRWDVLHSQFIDEDAVKSLAQGDRVRFLIERVSRMHLLASNLAGGA